MFTKKLTELLRVAKDYKRESRWRLGLIAGSLMGFSLLLFFTPFKGTLQLMLLAIAAIVVYESYRIDEGWNKHIDMIKRIMVEEEAGTLTDERLREYTKEIEKLDNRY